MFFLNSLGRPLTKKGNNFTKFLSTSDSPDEDEGYVTSPTALICTPPPDGPVFTFGTQKDDDWSMLEQEINRLCLDEPSHLMTSVPNDFHRDNGRRVQQQPIRQGKPAVAAQVRKPTLATSCQFCAKNGEVRIVVSQKQPLILLINGIFNHAFHF